MQSKFWMKMKSGWQNMWMLNTYPVTNIIVISIVISNLVSASYVLLTWGCLIPKFSAIIVLALNAIAITGIYHYSQIVKSGIKARKAMIEVAFETIHNGPLQTLNRVLRLVKLQDLSIKKILPELEKDLENLNQELRGIYEFWQQESLTHQKTNLYLGNSIIINLQEPLHEILYQVYSHTLERDFPCFRTIKLKIRNFEPIDEHSLTIEDKRGICRFLEEALCNVGKYATGATCLKVNCSFSMGWHTLSIVDDGLGVNSSVNSFKREGQGTKQFKNLARQIKGKFQRLPMYPQGTICELSWPGYLVSYYK
ncbi:sensor histidine kinase [Sphaerospermopsis kisseleviana CS-549]|uniref:Sensor histidine kinase n=1 Tax=Sphaerospermopsis kisseleviana CS-549 TaxID=3021783 RepID=A0ABT4ZZU6_9CYAN|nr:sensor histidine kinase [Sphaerospermopsis kisseleviana]MDB9444263.1 sensor histidine kinase [Sphaerospermopsis kisseleviana CS-549]